MHHEREDDYGMPVSFKVIAAFINRIGFPIFAFCVMTYICFWTLAKNTEALNQNTLVLQSLKQLMEQQHVENQHG